MNCHDAREGFSALSHGGMALTEWALLEAHVRQCVECSKGRESVQKAVSARQQALTRAHRQLPQLFLYSPVTIARQGAARAAIEAVRFAGLLARLRMSGHAAVRMIGASRARVAGLVVGLLARTRGVLPLLRRLSERIAVKIIGATWVVGRIVVTTSGRARSLSGSAATSLLSVACSFLRISTGIASLAILVATILFLEPVLLWSREWSNNLMSPPSAGVQLSQDARPPADWTPVDPAAEVQPAETQAPKSVSIPQPATTALAQPDPRRVTIRPKAPQTQAEIPPPLRIPDPALARSQVTASAPTPTPETTRSLEPSRPQEAARSQDEARSRKAEASDPAIDWLLKGGRGTSRRSIESP